MQARRAPFSYRAAFLHRRRNIRRQTKRRNRTGRTPPFASHGSPSYTSHPRFLSSTLSLLLALLAFVCPSTCSHIETFGCSFRLVALLPAVRTATRLLFWTLGTCSSGSPLISHFWATDIGAAFSFCNCKEKPLHYRSSSFFFFFWRDLEPRVSLAGSLSGGKEPHIMDSNGQNAASAPQTQQTPPLPLVLEPKKHAACDECREYYYSLLSCGFILQCSFSL